MNKLDVIKEIKPFIEGYNNDLKYVVNVECDSKTNYGECVIHEPGCKPRIESVRYTPFIYIKDLRRIGKFLYHGDTELDNCKKQLYGITITKLKTANFDRLKNGYCYKIESTKSLDAIYSYLRDGGIDVWKKKQHPNGQFIKDKNGKFVFENRDLCYSVGLNEQFFISTKSRLYKGIDKYSDIHRVTFDIETTGLRAKLSNTFAIGIRDNRGFEKILELDSLNDNGESEKKLVCEFFKTIIDLEPAIITGYNSEEFDFEYILERFNILGGDLKAIKTTLKENQSLFRVKNTSVKYGNTADKYTATKIWGISVTDILHSTKRTAAINSEIRETKLKYITKFEKISKPNRTYIKGDDNGIGKMYYENKMYCADENNNYIEIPEDYQVVSRKLAALKHYFSENKITEESYKETRKELIDSNPYFLNWFRSVPMKENKPNLITGRKLLRQYLLDDLWETEQVDELYNQSSFMLAKMVPTTYHRICTMGTASVWNLLLTAWSYENDLAIPIPDKKENFSGGLARCYKRGYSKNIVKIDFNSLYPMLQLTNDIFPIFDITGILRKFLIYLTSIRSTYKGIANGYEFDGENLEILKIVDFEFYEKYLAGLLDSHDIGLSKTKQAPVKILNNSYFGALGSDISFNWSDNISAARTTCCGRLSLRHCVDWFTKYDCIALLAVTDGINFSIPNVTNILVNNKEVKTVEYYDSIDKMWVYGNKVGIDALIDKFNVEEMKPPYMGVDNDGRSLSCLNLSRINYASLKEKKNKKTGELIKKIELTGNTIKSKIMPEYIEEFIDNGLTMILNGDGSGFVNYYYSYLQDLYNMRIPLKKIASKSKIKLTIKQYLNRGTDKNGKEKAKQAHMELLINERIKLAIRLIEEHNIKYSGDLKDKTYDELIRLASDYLPPEQELDSVVFYVNIGSRASHGNSKPMTNSESGICSKMIKKSDLMDNPNMMGEYNVDRYIKAFNTRVKAILVGFEPDVADRIIGKIIRKKVKNEFGVKEVVSELITSVFTKDELILKNFDSDSLEDSFYLEKKEVHFWNSFGYDPNKIWSGFKCHEDDKYYPDIYNDALTFLNSKMIESGKPLIKSINDNYCAGDYVLLKNKKIYSVGKYNGTYIDIIRENVDVPLSENQKILDKTYDESRNKIKNKTDDETLKLFNLFKEKYEISDNISMEILFDNVDGSVLAFEDFINEMKNEELIDIDEDFD